MEGRVGVGVDEERFIRSSAQGDLVVVEAGWAFGVGVVGDGVAIGPDEAVAVAGFVAVASFWTRARVFKLSAAAGPNEDAFLTHC